MNDVSIVTLPDGLRFGVGARAHSGDERYITEKHLSGEEYMAYGCSIRPEDTVIDIGAHIGRFTLFAAARASQGIVYAFEPQPDTRERLVSNIALNGFTNVVVSESAVADTRGAVTLHIDSDAARSSIYGESGTEVTVESLPLADVFEKHNLTRCAFIKSDCEGSEFAIFLALPRKYFSQIDQIVLEYHDHLSSDKKMFDLFTLFTEEGYQLRARWGAFYTGLLFARRTVRGQHRAGTVFLKIRNYFFVYGVDFITFCVGLVIARTLVLVGRVPLRAFGFF